MKNIEELGGKIINKLHIEKLLMKDRNTIEYVKTVNPRDNPEKTLQKLWGKRIFIIIVLIAAGVLLWISCFTDEGDPGLMRDSLYVVRPEHEKELDVEVSDAENKWNGELVFDVEPREFTEDECEAIGEKVESYAGDKLQGENESTSHICRPLVFVGEVPGTKASLKWSYDGKYIKDSGELQKDGIPENGVDTEIMLQAKWKNYDGTYYFPVHIDPPVYTDAEISENNASEAIQNSLDDQATEALVTLPDRYDYSEKKEEKSYLPVIAIVVVILLLPLVWKEQQKRALESREGQLLSDHPEFIHKIRLLLSAGLSFRLVVERMTAEYEKNLQAGGEKHYVYEELCIALQEMNDGVSEVSAIENFGKRCRCIPYLRFSSVISQNLKKGAEGIISILEKDAAEALEKRKQNALRLGEIAGTKLLFPMILMLGLVMGIIMMPAFMTM